MDERKQAGKDYAAGMKYKDISAKYDVPVNTLKSWRTRDHWKRGAPATKEVHPKRKTDAPKVAPKIIDELEANSELTDKQKLFCLFYLQRFNATWAYMKVYGAKRDTAMVSGSRLLSNVKIKQQLAELKKQQSTDLYFDVQDIVNELRQISKGDARDVVDFKTVKRLVWYKVRDKKGDQEDSGGKFRWEPKIDPETGEQAWYYENIVKLHDSDEIDTSNIKSIRIDKGEAVVEMYDKQRALESLAKLVSPDIKQQSRKLQAEADVVKAKARDLNDKGDDTESKVSKLLDKIDAVVKEDGNSD
ncbi:terminase [Lactobacillus plantarum] [Lactiplantibacillus mudanjiangensis]|uniref:terminase small subunit n=1 Tax=Lactiplantibacillus mudanjiangensis TaxID=1296538 RepID=UPI001015660D|nr:terminase [Lactobacillus plantarum] [Lactiplantibacillus mudanjiangensis]